VATIGYDQTTTHLKIFKKSDLSLIYSETKMPNIYANGITVAGDSAYIALQGQYPSFTDSGNIAVEDLVHQKFKRIIRLDTLTRGLSDMFSHGNMLVAVSEYPKTCIAEINLSTGVKKFVTMSTIYTPFDLIQDTLYAGYDNGIGGYNIGSNNILYDIKPNPYYAAAAVDTIDKRIYYTGGSYTSPTKTWIYDFNNHVIDSFDVGISPEGIAIQYVSKSGIAPAKINAENLRLFPNPANSVLNITGINADRATISIIDITGRVLFTESKTLQSSAYSGIPVSDLNQGVYFINIQTNDGIISRKFVKN
jgi:hypothetical protein